MILVTLLWTSVLWSVIAEKSISGEYDDGDADTVIVEGTETQEFPFFIFK